MCKGIRTFKAPLLGLLFLFAMVLCPGAALADRSLSMEQLIIDAELLPDASLRITERITVDFPGAWNGFFVKIPQGDTPISDVSVSEDDQPYTFNPGAEYGPPGTYLTKHEGDDLLIDWSVNAADETRTFDVSYRVTDAVKIHSDTAELYRKFVGEANDSPISYVQVNLKLPPGAGDYRQGEEIRIWGHGPLHGEVEFAGSDKVTWEIRNLPPRTFMEGRVAMPTGLFTEAPSGVYTAQPALARILAEEQDNAQRANRARVFARAKTGIAAGVIGLAFAGAFLMWRRFGRSHRAANDYDYYRELPASYSPAELSVLWNFNKLQARDFTATILDLARRGFLRLEEQTVKTRRFLRARETVTYQIFFLPPPEPGVLRNPAEAVLRPHERQLLEYLRDTIGGGGDSIFLMDIESYAKRHSRGFYGFWKKWSAGLLSGAQKHQFFDDHGPVPVFTMLGGVGIMILGGILTPRADIVGLACVAGGMIFFGVAFLFKRRSASGQDDYMRWGAFKRFLQHFSEMERHDIPSLVVWEHYLVYAVTLGVAKEVIRQLPLVFPDLREGDHRFGYGWWHYGAYSGMHGFNASFDGIGNSIEKAVATAQTAVGRSSSAGGAGGGFTGGGGFGGGGGSYGGR